MSRDADGARFVEERWGKTQNQRRGRRLSGHSRPAAAAPPTPKSDDRPYALDDAEGPSTLQKTINGSEHARKSESKRPPMRATFKRIAEEHRADGEQAKGG